MIRRRVEETPVFGGGESAQGRSQNAGGPSAARKRAERGAGGVHDAGQRCGRHRGGLRRGLRHAARVRHRHEHHCLSLHLGAGQRHRTGPHPLVRRPLGLVRTAAAHYRRFAGLRRPRLRVPVCGQPEQRALDHRPRDPHVGHAVPGLERHLRQLLPGAFPLPHACHRVRDLPEHRAD